MRQAQSQKANTKSSSTLWNAVWQLTCPWVTGGEIPPLKSAARMRSESRVKRLRSFAGMVVLAGTLMFSGNQPVLAKDNSGPIVIASLNPAIKQSRLYDHVSLFGAGEQQFSDLSAFTKWDSVLKRFDKTFKSSMNKPYVQDWLSMLAGLENASAEKKLAAVNAYMNKVKFVADADNYGSRDYWATPMEFLKNGGDCEDYAFAKYISLQALGFSKNDMRLAIVYDHVMRMPHAVLIVYTEGEAKVLDNQNPAILESAEITRYKPIYSISEVAWWRH